jgi:DNA-3-methyladenine glycosylase I
MEKLSTCPWCLSSELYKSYHDQEWGRPVREEIKMFEFLLLETFQAGLSWITVLNKREGFRRAFHSFDMHRVAAMTEGEVVDLMQNAGIIRHEGKIRAAISNAQMAINLENEGSSLVNFFWSYVNHIPINNSITSTSQVPGFTKLSERISKDLKKRGFKFVGPTVIYAHMQATGMVNDHLTNCPQYAEIMKG